MHVKKKVLLIEDEESLIKPLRFSLEKAGADLMVAKDGDEGLSMLAQSHPDLILLDLVLPKKSGFDVLSEIKKNAATKNIPVVIVSNLARSKDISRGLAGGAADYIVKANFSIALLMERIRPFLEK